MPGYSYSTKVQHSGATYTPVQAPGKRLKPLPYVLGERQPHRYYMKVVSATTNVSDGQYFGYCGVFDQ